METTTYKNENRRANRFEVDCSLKFSHLPSHKTMRGKCLNISDSGALLLIPMHIPVIEDQQVEIAFSSNALTQINNHGLSTPDNDLIAKVVRIDRQAILEEAGIRVGLEFISQDQ